LQVRRIPFGDDGDIIVVSAEWGGKEMSTDRNLTTEPTTRLDWFIFLSLTAPWSYGLLIPLFFNNLVPKSPVDDFPIFAGLLWIMPWIMSLIATEMVRERSLKMKGSNEDRAYCQQLMKGLYIRHLNQGALLLCYFLLIKPNSAIGKWLVSIKPRLNPSLATKFIYPSGILLLISVFGYLIDRRFLYGLFPVSVLMLYVDSTEQLNLFLSRDAGIVRKLFWGSMLFYTFGHNSYLESLARSRAEEQNSPDT
jgi:hypothetical protein